MALIGTAIKGALGGYGEKPKVPKFKPIDLTQEQSATIAGNASNLPASEALASRINLFNQSEYDKMLESSLPGYANIKSKISQNIQSELAGNIPEDVAMEIQRRSAAQSFSGGFAGSGMAKNLTARDLGLTSLNLTQQGLDSTMRWMSQAKAPQFDVSSMFISPMQRAAFSTYERDTKFNRDWLKNQVAAAPDPFMAALGDAFIQEESQIMSMAGSAAGASSGGGSGGGGM